MSPATKRRKALDSPSKETESKMVIEDNIIRFHIENASQLDEEPAKSEVKNIGGFNWHLSANIDEEFNSRYPREQLNILLECEESGEVRFPWFCVVTTNAKLISVKDDALSIHKRSVNRLASSFLDSAFVLSAYRDNVFDPEKEFVTDNSITVEVRVDIVRSGRKDLAVKNIDFFSTSNISDVILVVEGQKLHVNKQILTHHSSFFETLFFGNFKEAKESEITIEDVTVEEMVALLKAVYGSHYFRPETIEGVLKLADRFDMKIILAAVDNYLVGENFIDLKKRLIMADKYKLMFTVDECIKQITTRDYIKSLREMEEFESLSDGVKDELFDLTTHLSP